jgi:hypothetical protein
MMNYRCMILNFLQMWQVTQVFKCIITEMFDNIKAFPVNFQLWENQLKMPNFVLFL